MRIRHTYIYVRENELNPALPTMQVDVKRARAKPGKVFVGGLKAEMSDDDIKEAFSQYGAVTEMELPFDKVRTATQGCQLVVLIQSYLHT